MDERESAAADGDAPALAARVAQAMFARDRASQGQGIRVLRVGPGEAEVSMRVRPDMLNAAGTCHGGFVFLVADSAFSYASNSYNLSTVAAGCTIDFLAPAYEGDVLTAVASVRDGEGRSGVCDIEVTNQRGERVALARGRSHRVRGLVIGDPPKG
jgi:acyl-CoA thioesterase